MALATCPDASRLSDYLSRSLPKTTQADVEDHVLTCTQCKSALSGFDSPHEPLVHLLRARPADAPHNALALEQMMTQARSIGQDLGRTSAASDSAATVAIPPPLPARTRRIGKFELLEEIGQGGMGQVFRARDTILNRDVAIKIPQPGHPSLVPRFQNEAQAMACVGVALSVCQVFEAGVIDEQPYLAMAYIPGSSLAKALKEPSAETIGSDRDCVALIMRVLRGLATVHAAGIIHRDIKPGNILLDKKGQPFLTDFGLALMPEAERQTTFGCAVGTPGYMAPEQAAGKEVKPCSDVYAVGVVLYQLLGTRSGQHESDAVLRASVNRVPLRELRPDLDPALEAIVHRATAIDPIQRAQTAEELIGLLEGWLARKPIPVPPWPWWRNATAAAVLFVVTAVAVVVPQIVIIIKNPDGSETSLTPAKDSTVVVTKDGKEVSRVGGEVKPAKEPREALCRNALVPHPTPLAGAQSWTLETAGHRGAVRAVVHSPKGNWLASAGDDGSVRIWDAATAKLVRVLMYHPEAVAGLAWSPDERYLASAGYGTDPVACVWEAETGRLVRTVPISASVVAWSSDSKLLAIPNTEAEPRVDIVDVHDGKKVRSLDGAVNLRQLAWSSDGKTLAGALEGDSGKIHVWDASGKELKRLDGEKGRAMALAFSPDGSQLASASTGKDPQLWDARAGRLLRTLAVGAQVNAVAWSADGKVIASLTNGIGFWLAEDGKMTSGIPIGGQALSWSRDGKRLAVGDHAGTITLFDSSGGTAHTIRGHDIRALHTPALSRDGKRLAYVDMNSLWLRDVLSRKSISVKSPVHNALAWSPDGATLAAYGEKTIRLIDGKTGKEELLERKGLIGKLAWSGDGKYLALCGSDNSLCVYDVKASRSVLDLPGIAGHSTPYIVLGWSSDARSLTYSAGTTLTTVDVQTGRKWQMDNGDVTAVAWSPDGKRMAIANGAGRVRITDATGNESGEIQGSELRIVGLAWLPGGQSVKCLFVNNTSRILDLKTGILGKPAPGLPWSGSGVEGGLIVSTCKSALYMWDSTTEERHGALLLLQNNRRVTIGPEGHYHSDDLLVEPNLVYVVATEKGQETYTVAEFSRRFGFKNAPDKALLLPR